MPNFQDETIESSANDESNTPNDATNTPPSPPVATTSTDDGLTATKSSVDKIPLPIEKSESTESYKVQTTVTDSKDSDVNAVNHKSIVDGVSHKSKDASAVECSKATSDAANVSDELGQKQQEDEKDVVDAEAKDETVIIDKDKSSQ